MLTDLFGLLKETSLDPMLSVCLFCETENQKEME